MKVTVKAALLTIFILFSVESKADYCKYPNGEPVVLFSEYISKANGDFFPRLKSEFRLVNINHKNNSLGLLESKFDGVFNVQSAHRKLSKSLRATNSNDDCPGRLKNVSHTPIRISTKDELFVSLTSTVNAKAGYCYKRISGGEIVNKRSWKKHVAIDVIVYVFATVDDDNNLIFHVTSSQRSRVIKNNKLPWFARFLYGVTGVIRGQNYKIPEVSTAIIKAHAEQISRQISTDIFDDEFYKRWENVSTHVSKKLKDQITDTIDNPKDADIRKQWIKWSASALRIMHISPNDLAAPPDCSIILKTPDPLGFYYLMCLKISEIKNDRQSLVKWNRSSSSGLEGKIYFEEVPGMIENHSPKLPYGPTCRLFKLAAQNQQGEDKIVAVSEGDSLWKISEGWYGIGSLFHVISSFNKLSEYNRIDPGDTLVLPNLLSLTEKMVAIPNDNLWDLNVRDYATEEFKIANPHIIDSDLIYGGQYIWLDRGDENGTK